MKKRAVCPKGNGRTKKGAFDCVDFSIQIAVSTLKNNYLCAGITICRTD
jgi:hypothetical protein